MEEDETTRGYGVAGAEAGVVKLAGFETVRGDVTSYVFHYAGPVDELLQRAPARGGTWEEADGPLSSYTVVGSSVERHECGMGEMTVTCVPFRVGQTDGPETERYEVQFAETSQPLAFHPDFPGSGNGGNGPEMDAWRKFLVSPEAVQLQGKYMDDPGDENGAKEDLPEALREWARLHNRGIRQFAVYLPVIVRVSTYEMRPSSVASGVGKTGGPPDADVIPSGFEGGEHWLKTGDGFAQEPGTGKWTRTETWTYAHEWPTLLYGAG